MVLSGIAVNRAMLTLVIEDEVGNQRAVAPVRDVITIGRNEDNAICLVERNVSRHHARVVVANGTASVEDLESANGVLLNGQRIVRNAVIHEGDWLQIGDFALLVQDSDRPVAARSARSVRSKSHRQENPVTEEKYLGDDDGDEVHVELGREEPPITSPMFPAFGSTFAQERSPLRVADAVGRPETEVALTPPLGSSPALGQFTMPPAPRPRAVQPPLPANAGTPSEQHPVSLSFIAGLIGLAVLGSAVFWYLAAP